MLDDFAIWKSQVESEEVDRARVTFGKHHCTTLASRIRGEESGARRLSVELNCLHNYTGIYPESSPHWDAW